MRLLLFPIKSQHGVVYNSVAYKKGYNVVLQSSKHEEITFPHEFIFYLPRLSLGNIAKKMLSVVGDSEKYVKGGWPNVKNCLWKEGFNPFAHYDPQTCRYSLSLLKFLKVLVSKQYLEGCWKFSSVKRQFKIVQI